MISTLTKNSILTVTCSTALFVVACSAPSGNIENGKRWYEMHNCSSCHGPTGSDGRAIGIADLDMSFSSFVSKLRNKESQIMPYFPESKVSEQDAADIYAFLKSNK